MEAYKTRAQSACTMTELILPNDTNLLGNLLGGRLMHWIDIAAAMAAMRHSEGLVATISVDSIEFRCPVKLSNIVTLSAFLTWSGTTSMEVAVDVYVEDALRNSVIYMTRVYLAFVALDENGAKKPIVPYQPLSADEQADYEAALQRRAKRLAKKEAPGK